MPESPDLGCRDSACAVCDDDGWIEVGELRTPEHCPHLDQPWHRPFNYTGLLDGNNGIITRLAGDDDA